MFVSVSASVSVCVYVYLCQLMSFDDELVSLERSDERTDSDIEHGHNRVLQDTSIKKNYINYLEGKIGAKMLEQRKPTVQITCIAKQQSVAILIKEVLRKVHCSPDILLHPSIIPCSFFIESPECTKQTECRRNQRDQDDKATKMIKRKVAFG